MAKAFRELRDRMPAARQARIVARTEELLATLPLHEIRQARELSQEELAKKLHVRQAAVSKVEHRTDIYISTLRRHIEAMGGSLIIEAKFPEGRYQISSFAGLAQDTGERLDELPSARKE